MQRIFARGATSRYVPPQSAPVSLELDDLLMQSGTTEDIYVDDTVYTW